MFISIYKQYPENFAFLMGRIFELFTHEVCKFVCKVISKCLLTNFLHISRAHISRIKRYNVKSSTRYFPMKTKTLADFLVCINVPLMLSK